MPHIAGIRGVLPETTRDATRAIYRYHLRFADPANGRVLIRKMVVCAVRLEPWADGLVRPHEATDPVRKAAALAALRSTYVAPAPVLAGYRDAAGEVERLFRRVDNERPTLELTTPDGAVHRIWRVQSAELLGQLRHALAPKRAIVLDGHDRYEAMLAYRDELAAHQPLAMYSSANYSLMCLTQLDDPALTVAPRPRAIRGALPSAAALAAARPYFIIEKLAGAAGDLGKQRAALADTLAHQPGFIVVWAGEPDAWKLTLSPDISPVNAGVAVNRALQRLEPIVADQLFVERAMPGARLEHHASTEEALAAKADAVMIMRPLTVEQISHIVELGEVLPAGSTAFAPRLAPGIVSAIVDPDEDLV
jgi:uncharacterized protein (DUF1015 family)